MKRSTEYRKFRNKIKKRLKDEHSIVVKDIKDVKELNESKDFVVIFKKRKKPVKISYKSSKK